MSVVLCILRIDCASGKVYNKTGAQISLEINKSITGTGFIPRPLKYTFFQVSLKKFLDCLPHHPQRLRNPVAVLPTYIPRNGVARGTVRFLCGGSYMALVGFRLHRLPPSHRGYILTYPSGNVNTFFQKK